MLATWTWKNSSRLDEKMARNLARSSILTEPSWARSSSLEWKSRRESSRLRNRSSSSAPIGRRGSGGAAGGCQVVAKELTLPVTYEPLLPIGADDELRFLNRE